jgi:simple sugar transport system ATP-binding protein
VQAAGAPLLALRGVSKLFGGVRALDHVDFTIRAGEVHCLAGENGSGKSTLIKVISGVHRPDEGEIRLHGAPHRALTPREAIAAGVQVIYQDFSLFPNLTVAENLTLAQEVHDRRKLVSPGRMRATAEAALARLGDVSLDLQAEVERLPVAGRQLVAIARALIAEARLLVMDEPTTALTHHEVEQLFARVRALRDRGLSVLFVSHKMREMLEIADSLTVLRNGRVVAEGPMRNFDERAITRAMTGSDLADARYVWKPPAAPVSPRLELCGLTVPGQVKEVSLSLMPGEIVGLGGLLGSGRTELGLALFGMRPGHRGTVLVDGQALRLESTGAAVAAGIAYVPEDRLTEGLFPTQTIARNLLAASLDRLRGPLALLRSGRGRAMAARAVREMAIATPTVERAVSELSGGNQQRVVIGRWLLTDAKVLILNGPTVGVDIGSKAGIHRKLRELAQQQGLAVLMISDDTPELAQNCNRVLLMHRGRIVGELAGEALTDDALTTRLRSLT